MKLTKRILAMALALMMVLSLSVSAFASEGHNHKIIIKNSNEGYTYTAYQIFSGNLGSDGVLSNIQWGEGVDHSKVEDTAEEIAMKLSDNTLTAQDLIDMVNNKTLILTNPTGTSTHVPANNLYKSSAYVAVKHTVS